MQKIYKVSLPKEVTVATKLEDLLSTKVSNSCLFGKLVTLEDVLLSTEVDLLRLPGFGRASLREVKEMVKTYGLKLGMSTKKIRALRASDMDSINVLNRQELISLFNKLRVLLEASNGGGDIESVTLLISDFRIQCDVTPEKLTEVRDMLNSKGGGGW